MAETTLLQATNKHHNNLTNNQVELLNLLGNSLMQPRRLLATYNTYHRTATADITFGNALLSLIMEGYVAVRNVQLEPKPRLYAGTLTVNPDGTATFHTNKQQYGPKLTLHVKGVTLYATNVTAKVTAQTS